MKLKKSLLALTTAATVAVAGSTAAVAEEDPSDNRTPVTYSSGQSEDGDKEEPSKLTGSYDFFGWDEDTEGLEKLKDVVTLVTTIGALVAGIVTLATNIGKIQNLFK